MGNKQERHYVAMNQPRSGPHQPIQQINYVGYQPPIQNKPPIPLHQPQINYLPPPIQPIQAQKAPPNPYIGHYYGPQIILLEDNPGNAVFFDNSHLIQNADIVKCICITVILQNILYIIASAIYNKKINWTELGFVILGIEAIAFTAFLCKYVKNRMCSTQNCDKVKRIFIRFTILHTFYFIVISVLLWLIIYKEKTHEKKVHILIYMGISALILLVPRFIVMFMNNMRVSKRR